MKNNDRSTLMLTSLIVFVLCAFLAGGKFTAEYEKTTGELSDKLATADRSLARLNRKLESNVQRLGRAEIHTKDAAVIVQVLERQVRSLSADQLKNETIIQTLRTQLMLANQESIQLREDLDEVRRRMVSMELQYAIVE
ncbi:MAG: hypothetical protein AAGA18_09910 [Verrucomicrobiota bacterium]